MAIVPITCTNCHGNGRDSDLWGKDIRCGLCSGEGEYRIDTRELDNETLEQMNLESSAELQERAVTA